MTGSGRVAVVGASVAGVAAADGLRRAGFAGAVHLYDSQPRAPYDKPPLSKGFLLGDVPPEDLALKSAEQWQELDVDLRLGQTVRSVDAERTLTTPTGRHEYDGIILASGTRPRAIPFMVHPDARTHVLRTPDDAVALREDIASSEHVVIIGGGFIGLEIASAVSTLGRRCTVIEPNAHPLGHAVGVEVSRFVTDRHRASGCEFRTGVAVTEVDAAPNGGAVVRLSDGDVLDADVVVVSIGVEPATDLLLGSGVDLDGGVLVDEYCRSNVAGIYACGDVTRSYSVLYAEHLRIEHWTTAREQGVHAAANLVAELQGDVPTPFGHVPYVWSDQLDMKIQIVGRLVHGAAVSVTHADDDTLAVAFHLDGVLCGGATINRARDAMQMRRTMHQHVTQLLVSTVSSSQVLT